MSQSGKILQQSHRPTVHTDASSCPHCSHAACVDSAGNPSSPSDVLDLSAFWLQITNNASIGTTNSIAPALLTTGYTNSNFYLNPATNGVVFKVYGAPVYDGADVVSSQGVRGDCF